MFCFSDCHVEWRGGKKEQIFGEMQDESAFAGWGASSCVCADRGALWPDPVVQDATFLFDSAADGIFAAASDFLCVKGVDEKPLEDDVLPDADTDPHPFVPSPPGISSASAREAYDVTFASVVRIPEIPAGILRTTRVLFMPKKMPVWQAPAPPVSSERLDEAPLPPPPCRPVGRPKRESGVAKTRKGPSVKIKRMAKIVSGPKTAVPRRKGRPTRSKSAPGLRQTRRK